MNIPTLVFSPLLPPPEVENYWGVDPVELEAFLDGPDYHEALKVGDDDVCYWNVVTVRTCG